LILKKHEIVLVDEDAAFVERVMKFLPVSGYAEQISLQAFTTDDAIDRASRLEAGSKLFVFSEKALYKAESAGKIMHFRKKVQLEEHISGEVGNPQAVLESGATPKTLKYQSLKKLFEQLCEWDNAFEFGGASSGTKMQGGPAARVTAVYSAKGGAGTTTVALHIAHSLHARKRKTLFVPLENFPPAEDVAHRSGQPKTAGKFSQFIYYLLTDAEKLHDRWDAFIDGDAAGGMHVLVPDHRELNALKESSATDLIDALAKANRYDHIVLDLDSALHPRTTGAMKRSDQIVWLLLPDQACLRKTDLARTYFPDDTRIHWVMNKHTGAAFPGIEERGLNPIMLPYIPEWKHMGDSNRPFEHRQFSEAIGFLVETVFGSGVTDRRLRTV